MRLKLVHAVDGGDHARAPWHVARWLEVEVASQGESVEEALANLKEALELYFEDGSAPDPGEPPIIASVEIAA